MVAGRGIGMRYGAMRKECALHRKLPDAVLAVLAVLVALVLSGPGAEATPNIKGSFEPFAPDSSFRTPIPDGVALDPNSEAMVASATRGGGLFANLVRYGIPIYHADSATPRHVVECTITSWGRCPFDGLEVPIPDGARPHGGSDGAMVVADNSTRESFEFWRAKHVDGRWTVSFGAVMNLNGSGWGGTATASGASRLGGVIQIAEIQQGVIPHALALQTENACAGELRFPATRTDGHSSRPDCLPEGARLRLDPTVDLAALSLPPAVRMVARALQVYGGYVVDTGGAPLSVSFELDPGAANGGIGAVYQQAGLRWDYDNMPGVPWDRLQVLA